METSAANFINSFLELNVVYEDFFITTEGI